MRPLRLIQRDVLNHRIKKRKIEMQVGEVIKLATENAEYKRSIGDLLLVFIQASKGKKHVSIRCKDETLRYVFGKVDDLLEENKKLKENLQAIKG